jgi:hypothetical protein
MRENKLVERTTLRVDAHHYIRVIENRPLTCRDVQESTI